MMKLLHRFILCNEVAFTKSFGKLQYSNGSPMQWIKQTTKLAPRVQWNTKHRFTVPMQRTVIIGGLGLNVVVQLARPTYMEWVPVAQIKHTPMRRHAQQKNQHTGIVHQIKEITVNGFRNLLRILELLLYFTPCLLSFPIVYCTKNEWIEYHWAKLLASSMELAGPTFVKLGQWASTRSDMFALPTRQGLSSLHSNVSVEAWKKTIATLRSALSNGLLADHDKHMFQIESIPIGAGCIAQVHRAKMKDSNGSIIDTAVKIRRYGAVESVERDLSLLVYAAHSIQIVFNTSRWLTIVDCVDCFADFMRQQLDLRIEGENLIKFKSNFKQDKGNRIKFPEFVTASADVLIESMEPGESLSTILHSNAEIMTDPSARKELAKLGIDAFLKMVVLDNFCHSDLHPGNILVRYHEVKDNRIAIDGITFLDVGLSTSLTLKDQENFVDLFAAVSKGAGKEAGRLILTRSRRCCEGELFPRGCINPEEFINGVDRVVQSVNRDSFCLGRVQIGKVLQDIMTLVQIHCVELDPTFTTLILSMIILEGVGRQLDPELDIFKASAPVLAQSLKQRFCKSC